MIWIDPESLRDVIPLQQLRLSGGRALGRGGKITAHVTQSYLRARRRMAHEQLCFPLLVCSPLPRPALHIAHLASASAPLAFGGWHLQPLA
jgi:hypothetical protein